MSQLPDEVWKRYHQIDARRILLRAINDGWVPPDDIRADIEVFLQVARWQESQRILRRNAAAKLTPEECEAFEITVDDHGDAERYTW